MKNVKNIDAWLSQAPEQVKAQTENLLVQVEKLRQDYIIYPAQNDILNALAYVPPEQVRVVILGQDPYHEPGQAMGLSFSVPAGCKLPPSLRNIYKELAADLGCALPTSGDLTPWAQQGVLLLNTTLTVKEHAANSHSKLGWQILTDYVMDQCMKQPQPIVCMGWGRPALSMIEKARQNAGNAAQNKFCIASTHPSPLSANRGSADLPAFMGSRPFSQANNLLQAAGAHPIDWACVADYPERLF